MTRMELYHEKTKHIQRKGPLLFLFLCLIILSALLLVKYYEQSSIRLKSSDENLGKKVIVYLKNGQEVFTYEKLIVHNHGKTYYKGERNTIDLTGGTITYKNWK